MRLFALATATAIMLSGCVQPNPSGIQPARYGYTVATEAGVVVSKRPVEVSTGNSGVGATIGALAGGIAGSQIGPSRSRRGYYRSNAASVLGAFGGVIVGGLIGSAIENDLSRRIITEYVVQLDDGSLVTIVQENETFTPEQRVFLQTTQGGYGQLVPAG